MRLSLFGQVMQVQELARLLDYGHDTRPQKTDLLFDKRIGPAPGLAASRHHHFEADEADLLHQQRVIQRLHHARIGQPSGRPLRLEQDGCGHEPRAVLPRLQVPLLHYADGSAC